MSGLKGYIAMAKESVYGTPVVPTRAYEFATETLDDAGTWAQSAQVRKGRMAPSADRRQRSATGAAGNLQMEVPTKGLAHFLAMVSPGNLPAAVETPAASGAFTRNGIVIGRPNWDQESFTVVVGRPRSDGTIVPFTYVGCVITSMTVTFPAGDDFASVQFEIDAREERTDIAEPAALTYDTGLGGFMTDDAVLLLDGVEPIGVVRSGSYTCGLPMDTSRRGMNTGGKKRRPLANGMFAGTATFAVDFEDLSYVAAAKTKKKTHVITVEQVGVDVISGAIVPRVKHDLLVGYNAGVSPNISGADSLSQELGFVILDRETRPGPVVIDILSAEPVAATAGL